MSLKLVRKADLIIVAVIIIAAAGFLLLKNYNSKAEKLTAEIIVDGRLYETVDLSSVNEQNRYILDTDPQVVIMAENGQIWFEKSDCPDKVCVKSGKLKHKGDTAVCLPAKTIVTILGSDLDALTY